MTDQQFYTIFGAALAAEDRDVFVFEQQYPLTSFPDRVYNTLARSPRLPWIET